MIRAMSLLSEDNLNQQRSLAKQQQPVDERKSLIGPATFLLNDIELLNIRNCEDDNNNNQKKISTPTVTSFTTVESMDWCEENDTVDRNRDQICHQFPISNYLTIHGSHDVNSGQQNFRISPNEGDINVNPRKRFRSEDCFYSNMYARDWESELCQKLTKANDGGRYDRDEMKRFVGFIQHEISSRRKNYNIFHTVEHLQ